MLFGSYKTAAEQLVSDLVKNQNIDTSPSKLYLVGNDIAILNLRPNEPEKMIGRSGRFRQKGHSGHQDFLDRLSKETPLYLQQDE
jgi:hypothetical protein